MIIYTIKWGMIPVKKRIKKKLVKPQFNSVVR